MKRLYKGLAAIFLFSTVLFVLIFAVSLYKRGKDENGRYLDPISNGRLRSMRRSWSIWRKTI